MIFLCLCHSDSHYHRIQRISESRASKTKGHIRTHQDSSKIFWIYSDNKCLRCCPYHQSRLIFAYFMVVDRPACCIEEIFFLREGVESRPSVREHRVTSGGRVRDRPERKVVTSDQHPVRCERETLRVRPTWCGGCHFHQAGCLPLLSFQ